MTTIVIEAKNVSRVYATDSGDVEALKGVTLEIASGEFVALRGRSGSGKTTLLNCLGGLDNPSAGKIWIQGEDIAQLHETDRTRWRRKRIGFVFQQMGLMASFSAYENLELMARLGGVPRRDRRQRILKNLERVGLTDYYDHRPYEMSGGQQQRIAIARALVTEPSVILADEPTSELDSETTHDVLTVLRRVVRDKGVSILLSSHDPIVDEYADKIIHLRDGKIADSPEENALRPQLAGMM